MSDEAKPEMLPRLVVCSGVTELTDGTMGMILEAVNEKGEREGGQHLFPEKKCRKAGIWIGGMYMLETNSDFTSALIGSAKYQSRWMNEMDLASWKATERAFEIARTAKKRHAEDKNRNAIAEALAPIREAYLNTNYLGRLAIEVQVLAYLRGTKIS